MAWRSRRDVLGTMREGVLGTMGLAVAGGCAGCTGHDEVTESERTPDDRPRQVTDTEDPVQWQVDANGTVRDLHGAGEQIVVVSNTAGGETDIVAHDADNGTEQWRYETGEVRGIVADGQNVYATTDDALVALGNP